MAVEHSAFIHGYWPQVVATAPDAEGLVAVTRREPRSDAFPHHRFNSALSPSVSPESAQLVFRLQSPDGDQGYPGTLDAETMYRLSAAGELASSILLPRSPVPSIQ